MRPVFRVPALAVPLVLLLLHFGGSLAQAEMRVFVADQTAGTVRQYSAAGGDLGVFAGGLSRPSNITADGAGNVYVSETGPINFGPGNIRKFSPAGELLLTIPTEFNPAGLRVASDGTIYVANYLGHAVHHYSATGVDLGVFVSIPAPIPELARADFIAFDASGYLYVTDFPSRAIRRISPAGADLGNFISGIAGLPEGIAFDGDRNLYERQGRRPALRGSGSGCGTATMSA
jgi:sugar lactone lactonase YvrE